MNFFAHALPFLGNHYFMAGTCLPDWLSVVNRKVRVRQRKVLPFTESSQPDVAAVAKGVVQHHRDDEWFHETAAFAQLNLDFSLQLRDRLGIGDSLRTRFVGHILIEMLLDNFLHSRFPGKLQAFYRDLETMNLARLQTAVEVITNVPDLPLAGFLPKFVRSRFIFDYERDDRLLFRINQVLARVGLLEIESQVLQWLPTARLQVEENASALLYNYSLSLRSET